MQTKDWILLFAPIVCNGVLIFIIQKTLTIKIEKSSKSMDLKLSVLSDFRKLIISSLMCMNKLIISMNSGLHSSEEMDDFTNSVRDIANYYSVNIVVLKKYEKEVKSLVDKLNLCIGLIKQRGGDFTSNDQSVLKITLNEIKETLEKISENCFNLYI